MMAETIRQSGRKLLTTMRMLLMMVMMVMKVIPLQPFLACLLL